MPPQSERSRNRRFSLRGLAKVWSERVFVCLALNIRRMKGLAPRREAPLSVVPTHCASFEGPGTRSIDRLRQVRLATTSASPARHTFRAHGGEETPTRTSSRRPRAHAPS